MSNHPTVVAHREYLKKHPEAKGKMLLGRYNSDGSYEVYGHREQTEHEKEMFKYCCCHPNELRGHEQKRYSRWRRLLWRIWSFVGDQLDKARYW